MKKEEAKEKEKNSSGKRNRIFIGIGIIAVLLLVGITIILLSPKDVKKEKTKEKDPIQENKEQEIPSVPDYYMLVSALNMSGLPKEYFGYFFGKESYTNEEVSNQIKIYMAIYKVIIENAKKYEDPSKEIQISQKDVEKEIKNIFGKDTTIKHESLVGNSCNYSAFKYDKAKKAYIQKPGECDESQTMSILTEQSDIQVLEEKVEFTIKAAFVDFTYNAETGVITYEYFNDATKQIPIGTSEEYSLENVKENAYTYRFIFTNKDGQYQFDRVERIGA